MTETPPSGNHPVDHLGVLLIGDPVSRRPGRFQRFDVVAGIVTVPALLWSSESASDRLLIAFNGAVRRRDTRDPGEVFQRRTWVDDIPADVLFIADPTLHADNRLSIGWGQGGPGGYALPAMAQTAFFIAEALGVPAGSRLYFGSSAGGFQALQVAARDTGARVLVNNPQIDWTLYEPRNVATICHHTYADAPADTVALTYPDRTSAALAFAEFGHVPRTRFLLNAASENDAHAQLPALVTGLPTAASRPTPARIDVSLYVDEGGGHNPLSKSRTITEIVRALEDW